MVQRPSDQSTNLPWVEKYRPDTFQEIISHEDIINTIDKFIQEKRIPHLLLYGPPGTGKTTTILAIAKRLYGAKELHSMVLELNASDDRGIGIVRGSILSFASTKSIFNSGLKLIVLDEADAMTNDAQDALRRIMEKYTNNARFCLICNYLSKIKPAIQSRCTRFRFGPLSESQIFPRLDHIVEAEGVRITEDGKQALIDIAQGDMRKIINVLQSTHMASGLVDRNNVYLCCGQPLASDIAKIFKWLTDLPFREVHAKLVEYQKEDGIALHDIITHLHERHIHTIEVSDRLDIIRDLANIEYRLSSGANENLQLSALISAFQAIRA